jgi:CheY-like chemotaxis protein
MSDNRRRVLVVDDDAGIRGVLHLVLGQEGFQVREAENGRRALEALETWRADVILLDLMMPVMDGVSFLAEKRETVAIADIPVVVLTASRPILASTAEPLGCAATLSKPFDLNLLVDSVSALANGRAAVPAPVAGAA